MVSTMVSPSTSWAVIAPPLLAPFRTNTQLRTVMLEHMTYRAAQSGGKLLGMKQLSCSECGMLEKASTAGVRTSHPGGGGSE